MDIGGAFGGLASGIATLVQLSRKARLRGSMESDVKLYLMMKDHDDFDTARKSLSELIDHQARLLCEIGSSPQKRNHASGFVGLVFTALLALPLFWLIPRWDSWWAVPLVVSDCLAVLLFLYATVSAWSNPPRPKTRRRDRRESPNE